MEQTLQALSGILVKSIPTIFLLFFLYWYLKLMLFRPLDRMLRERRDMTAGAKQAAENSLANADRKAAEFEAKLREVRFQVYKEQEETRRQWLEDQAAQIAQARERMEASVKEAKSAIAGETAAARNGLVE